MSRVVIGVDPHKASNTLVVIDERERVLAQQRFANDRAGYRSMKTFARAHRDRVWAVEGARGVGAGLAQRLVAEGEPVLDVPGPAVGAGPCAGWWQRPQDRRRRRVRGRRCRPAGPGPAGGAPGRPHRDPADAHTRRQEVVAQRIATVNRLHDVLCQLIPGGAKRHLSATKARAAALSGAAPRRGREGPQAARAGLPR